MAKNAKNFEERPWGTFEVLHEFLVNNESGEETEVVIKKIKVLPQKKLSYQSHKLRHENWLIVQGSGAVVLNDEEIPVKKGSKIEVPTGTKHRIMNNHPKHELIFVEISTGKFDEFDIERFEDDFGRA